MTRSLKLPFAAALVVLLGSAVVSYWNIVRLVERADWVSHTHEVLAQTAAVRSALVDRDMLQRSVLLTRRNPLLSSLDRADAQLLEIIGHLALLTVDNPSQQSRIESLRAEIAEQSKAYRDAIASQKRQAADAQENLDALASGVDPRASAEIGRILSELEREESTLLARRNDESRASATIATVTQSTSTALGLFFLGAAYFLTIRDSRLQKQRNAELQAAQQELEQRVQHRTAELASANDKLHLEIEGHRATESDLRMRKLRYRSLVESISALVWNTGDSGELEGPMPSWTAFTGQTTEEVQGWGWLDAIHPDDRERTAEQWKAAVNSRTPYELQHRLRRRDGEYRDMHARGVHIFDASTGNREWVGVHVDVTDQLRARAALVGSKEAAEAANRAKSEFLANMSHEIRTPMNGVIGMVELVLDTALTRDQRDCLETVQYSANSLMTIINDILDFSKIEAGRMELDAQPFNLRDSLVDMLAPLAARAQAKGLELALQVAPNSLDAFTGDVGRIRQIVLNLVGNALKFTEQGHVLLRVRSSPTASGRALVNFIVEDTGPGIPADRLKAVFEPFTQVDGSVTRKYGGTGLGLSITDRLIKLMKGRIWVDSEVGRGTKFQFEIELDRQPTHDVRPVAQARECIESIRILLTGGSPTHQHILTEMLTQWRMQVTLAESTDAALTELDRAKVRGEFFSALLVDLGHHSNEDPGRFDRIYRHAGEQKIPLIILKPPGWKDTVLRSEQDGVATLEKPVRESSLFETIQALVGVKQHLSTSQPQNDSETKPLTPAGQNLNVLLVDDNRINQTVATRLLQRQGHRVTVAASGEEALSILAQQSFDVCLMDVQMPGMDGLETTQVIRQRESLTGRHMPIIALTAHAMKGDRERCLEAGMNGYVSKPIHADELRKAFAELKQMGEAVSSS